MLFLNKFMKIDLEKFIENENSIVDTCHPEIKDKKLVGLRIKISEDIHAYEYWKVYTSSKKFSNIIEFWKNTKRNLNLLN